MNPETRQIGRQKATFCTLKGHLLQAKRWHVAKTLIINGLQDCCKMR